MRILSVLDPVNRRWRPCRAAATLALAAIAASWARGGEFGHPRLFISRTDLAAIRHQCGIRVAAAAEGEAPRGKFGERAAEFGRLCDPLSDVTGEFVVSGETAAAAFYLMIQPGGRLAARCLGRVDAQLREPITITTDILEGVVALDWAWDQLPSAAKSEFIGNVRSRALPLTIGDSPLDARIFREKLGYLALAIVADDGGEPTPSWRALRARILAAAKDYFNGPFRKFVAWRGWTPTGPANAAEEECLAALALELAAHVPGAAAWPEHQDSVGRWLEHYLLVETSSSNSSGRRRGQVPRDDGGIRPLTPVPAWERFFPLTAALIAARTRNPAAATIADRVRAGVLQTAGGDHAAPLWAWAPILLDGTGLGRCDPADAPAWRNLRGAVVFRGGPLARASGVFDAASELTVWIEAGQPCLRRGQHFDAGHFIMQTPMATLTAQSGDGIGLESVPGKGGSQMIGSPGEPFDMEQFECATISHNGLLVFDVAHVPQWYGTAFAPRGGQRVVEGTCKRFEGEPENAGRGTGRLTACGACDFAAYAAVDLKRAYEAKTTASYTREFVLLWGRALLVIDRVRLAKSVAEPVCVFQIPTRPSVEGNDLDANKRVAGADADAGVWDYGVADQIVWRVGEAAVWQKCLLPAARRVRLVGGPGRTQTVPKGDFAGRAYMGGSASSFERLVVPSERERPRNAWYTLGTPTLMPEIATQHWGRVEIEPAARVSECVFASLLTVEAARGGESPEVSVSIADAANAEAGQAGGRAASARTIDAESPAAVRDGARPADSNPPGDGRDGRPAIGAARPGDSNVADDRTPLRGEALAGTELVKIRVRFSGLEAEIEIPADGRTGGVVRFVKPVGGEWLLPESVLAEAAWPTK